MENDLEHKTKKYSYDGPKIKISVANHNDPDFILEIYMYTLRLEDKYGIRRRVIKKGKESKYQWISDENKIILDLERIREKKYLLDLYSTQVSKFSKHTHESLTEDNNIYRSPYPNNISSSKTIESIYFIVYVIPVRQKYSKNIMSWYFNIDKSMIVDTVDFSFQYYKCNITVYGMDNSKIIKKYISPNMKYSCEKISKPTTATEYDISETLDTKKNGIYDTF